jgi:hypothetical protein
MITLLEEQAAMLQRHIAALKQLPADNSTAAAAAPTDNGPKKKKKRAIDPNRPKRPLSGYQMFMSEHNSKLTKQDHPDESATAAMSRVAREWANLPDDKKAVYNAKAEKLREHFHAELAEYKANKVEEDGESGDNAAPAPAPKKQKKEKPAVKAPAASNNSSSNSAPTTASKKAPAPTPAPTVIAVPVPVPVPTPTHSSETPKHEKSHKKHKHSDEDRHGDETEKKSKVRGNCIDLSVTAVLYPGSCLMLRTWRFVTPYAELTMWFLLIVAQKHKKDKK